jgi:hypothetical protein
MKLKNCGGEFPSIEMGIIYACKSDILMIDRAYIGLELTKYRPSDSKNQREWVP